MDAAERLLDALRAMGRSLASYWLLAMGEEYFNNNINNIIQQLLRVQQHSTRSKEENDET